MQTSRPAIVSRHQSAPSQMMAANPTAIPAAIPYNNNNNNAIPIHSNHNHNNNNTHSRLPPPMLVTQLPQHQQYPPLPPQGRIVSPVVSPVPPREPIVVGNNHAHGSPNHPAHVVPNQQFGGGGNHNNTMAWQHHQLPQLNTTRSHDADENEKAETSSDVSSIHMGSIRPDPNYDPAKDPTSPENMDKPFVAPLEITIRVVKERRRKTLSSYHSSTSHTTHTTHSMSTTVTPTHAEEDKPTPRPSEWGFQPHELPTTGSIPQLGLINSFASDDASASNNSFSGSADQFQSAEERMYLEEDLLELQQQGMEGTNHQHTEEVKQRKGMVRREFNRRIMRFKKHKNKKKHSTNTNTTINNNNTSNEFSGEDEDDNDSDASGNKIIIKLKIEDNEAKQAQAQVRANAQLQLQAHSAAPEQAPPLPKPQSKSNAFKQMSKNLHYPSPFGGRKHHRSNSMRMIVGQENGC